jgi:hypothetical protein
LIGLNSFWYLLVVTVLDDASVMIINDFEMLKLNGAGIVEAAPVFFVTCGNFPWFWFGDETLCLIIVLALGLYTGVQLSLGMGGHA